MMAGRLVLNEGSELLEDGREKSHLDGGGDDEPQQCEYAGRARRKNDVDGRTDRDSSN